MSSRTRNGAVDLFLIASLGPSMNEFPVDGLFDRSKPRGAHPDRVCFSGRSRPRKGDFWSGGDGIKGRMETRGEEKDNRVNSS